MTNEERIRELLKNAEKVDGLSFIKERIANREQLRKAKREKLKELMENEKTTIVQPPKNVGGYRFGNSKSYYTQFNLTHKPSWFHRNMMRICFGMYWFDAN